MIILGFDTAIRTSGYGVIKIESFNKVSVLDCGIIKNTQKMRHSECLRRIMGGMKELIKEYSPDEVVLEDAFYSKNVKTAMILSLARGVVIGTAAELDLPVYTYAPKTAKKAVVGTGAGSKEQVAMMLSQILKINIKDIPLDATDALSLAICHGQKRIVSGNSLLEEHLTKRI